MLGTMFLQRDLHLARADGQRLLDRYHYATELLATILERAAVFPALSMFADEVSPSDPEHLGRLQTLQRAVESFSEDCIEAEIRGRRARLFGARANGQLDASIAEPEESLAELGGALLPGDAG